MGRTVGFQREEPPPIRGDEIGRLVPLRNTEAHKECGMCPRAFMITRGLPVTQDDHPKT